MSCKSSVTSESMPFAFSMWKVFHNTITTMFKNLDTAENNLRMLVNTMLTSKEFSETLVPKQYNPVLMPESLIDEKQYEAFTVWLLGRLFYLLSYSKLEKNHHLFIKAQIRILDILQRQPHIHYKIIKDYINILTVLCEYMKKKQKPENEDVLLHYFIPDNTVMNDTELDLTPELVKVENDVQCIVLQKYTLEILTKTIFTYIACYRLDDSLTKTVDSFVDCLTSPKLDNMLIVLNFFTKIINEINFSSLNSWKLEEYIQRTISIMCQLFCNYNSLYISRNIEQSLSNVFNAVCNSTILSNFDIRKKCFEICNFYISEALIKKGKDNIIKEEFLKSVCKLLSTILKNNNDLYKDTDKLIEYILKVRISTFGYTLIEYQIFEEMKTYLECNTEEGFIFNINLLEVSNTWSMLSKAIDTNLNLYTNRPSNLASLHEFFIMLNNMFRMLRKVYFNLQNWCVGKTKFNCVNMDFIDITQFLIKVRKIMENKVRLNTESLDCVTTIISCFHCLISITNFTKQKRVEYEIMFYYMCYPFIGKVSFPNADPVLTTSLGNELPNDILIQKQTDSIKMLSVALANCNENEWKHFFIIRQWIFNILLYCGQNDSSPLFGEIIKYLPHFINTWQNEDIISEILHPIMKTKNTDILKILFENLGCIICQTMNNSSVVCIFEEIGNDEIIYYEIYCQHCDSNIVENSKNRIFKMPKVDFSALETNLSVTYLGYFCIKQNFVKKNLVKNLPRFAKHIDRFNSTEITKEWLKYTIDEDEDIRRILASNNTFVNTMRNMQEHTNISDPVKEHLTKMYLQSLVDATLQYFVHDVNEDKQETTLELINQIGQLPGDNILFVSVRLLIVYLIFGESISLIALNVLRQLAKSHNLTSGDLYTKYKKQCCQTIANMAKHNFVVYNLGLSISLKRVLLAFEITVNEFINRDGHHILPYFIPKFVTSPKSQPLLNELADLLMIDPSDVLISNFAYIYPHVYLNETSEMFKKCIEYIVGVTKTSESTLRKNNVQLVYNELLMRFHDKRYLVLKAIHQLILDNSSTTVTPQSINLQEIADGLNPRFLGVLVYFDSKLVAKRVCDEVKKNILLSLPEILKLMGKKYITPLRFKVLTTLRTALTITEEPFPKLTCDAWEAFVHCCEIESLGPLISTIFVALVPLVSKFPQKINSIFRYLLIENENKIKENIPDLFFLQNLNVKKDYKNVIEKHLNAQRPNNVLEQLNIFLKIITHEDREVSLYGLQYLKEFLSKKRLDLDDLILDSKGMSDIIVELIDILISGCRENNDDVKLACSECIGELGAIEPSHFPRKYTLTDSQFAYYITDDLFVGNALSELIRAFQMEKHTQSMNRYALAIQEILKVYGVSPEVNAPKLRLWNSFSDNLKELMLPLLSSKYTIAASTDITISTFPVYGSNLGSPFKDWAYNWTSYLISILKNEKQSLLHVCKPSLKQDQRTLMFFLPHILIHAIIECDDIQRQQIYNEFIAVLNSSNIPHKLDQFHLEYRPIKDSTTTKVTTEQSHDENGKNEYMKVIFVLLDYIDRWLLEWKSKEETKNTNHETFIHYQIIKNFMSQFCKLTIANCNYDHEEYPRALLYLEKYISEDKSRLNEQLGFLAKIYGQLEEPDGVTGALAMKQTEPSLEETILGHRLTGQLQDVAACYERLAQETILKPQYLQEMIRCYLELENPYIALNITQAAMDNYPENRTMLYELQAESFWRQNAYDKLSDLLVRPQLQNSVSWGVSIGKILQCFRLSQRDEFKTEINTARKTLTDLLTKTSIEEGVYRHGYSQVMKLHILNELQKAEEVVYNIKDTEDKSKCEKAINNLIDEWNFRLKIIQPSVRIYEPVLRLRRIILEQSQVMLRSQDTKNILNKHISMYWLKSAEIARQAGMFQQAYIYLLKAEQYKPLELFIEKGKFYWAKDDKERAFAALNRGIDEHFPDHASFKDMDPLLRKFDRKLCAEANLLIARYNEETANVSVETNLNNYREAVEIYKESEKSLVCLAQYYDKIFATMSEEDRDIRGGEIQVYVINYFGKALEYGSNYIYQSMPRMLSIWFDYGTRYLETRATDDENTKDFKKNILCKMITLIDNFLDRLPPYMFLSAFSQLVSRICHPVREVYMQIKTILVKIILKYPQQCMWKIMAVSKSGYSARSKRCQDIFSDQRLKNSTTIRLIYDFNRLAEKLIELCNKPVSHTISNTSINILLRALPRLLQNADFSEIILPIQKLMKLVLPNPELSNSDQDPFPNALIYIAGIEDQVTILQSLQRPRKITFRGSDGKQYHHILKPKDDLRKDYRLMEFNDVVNSYLYREAESRQRRLYIRTYSVMPLNEDCGIIEFINNLVGLRVILISYYKQKGIYINQKEIKSMACSLQDPLEKKKKVLLEKLLPRHPPMLSEWFRRTFPDAHHWYQARTAYTRTCSVISIVGYILGLGDRHGENILFDCTNGDVVHVDFNCLFNKGETFEWPERVPFRLTHNMIDAMGPLGVEGIFRKCCALTLRTLKIHTEILMSIVKPFVYDPLVSWPRNQVIRSEQLDAERTNEQAVEHIRNIELRLKGSYKARGKTYPIPLSCDGQVNNLILEATNIDNLSQMYIGWGSFM